MKKLFKGAAFIGIVTVVSKMIGAFYRIPLTNIIGAEGIGIYQMVFPLFSVLFTISAGGISGSIAKSVKIRFDRGDEKGARQVFFVALSTLTVFALIFTLFIVLMRERLAFIQGNSSASLPYLAIAPALIFSSVIACFRGYFQGRQNNLPSASSMLIEQFVKLGLGLFLARYLLQYSLSFAVFGALMGVALGELVSLLSLLAVFLVQHFRYKKRTVIKLGRREKGEGNREIAEANIVRSGLSFEQSSRRSMTAPTSTASKNQNDSNNNSSFLIPHSSLIAQSFLALSLSPLTYKQRNTQPILKELFSSAAPLIFASLIMPFVAFIDSIMVINILTSSGAATSDATAMFGLLNGPINSLINMPLVITFALSTTLVPKVRDCLKEEKPICENVGKHLKFSIIISILAVLILGIYAHSILNTIYYQGLTSSQIRLGALLLSVKSVAVFYVALIQISSGVLESANLSHKGAKNLLLGAVLKIILTLILLPYIGVIGAVVGTVACFSLTAILNIIVMKKHVKFNLKIREVIIAPLLSGIIFALISVFAVRYLPQFLPSTIALLVSLVIGGLVYVACLFLFRAIKKPEIINLVKKQKK
ncbi:MAG: oligosaccharide flippase family protein [Firmicutes bacterium]|nr:oligosaccharide flippase family protein [Bacillota bacterium]